MQQKAPGAEVVGFDADEDRKAVHRLVVGRAPGIEAVEAVVVQRAQQIEAAARTPRVVECPSVKPPRARYSETEARDLSGRVAALARGRPDLDVDPVALAEAVYTYALRKDTFVIRADREILDPLTEQGFDIVQADEAGPSERQSDRPSSTAGADTYRLRVIARKR